MRTQTRTYLAGFAVPRGLQVRALDTTDSLSFLEGRAAPYNVWADTGWGFEMEALAPGVFERSIGVKSDLPLLLFHNYRSFPVGVAEEWHETDDGLDAVWRLDGSDEAQRAARQARDGHLTGLSVGFIPEPGGSEFGEFDWDSFDPEDETTWMHVTRHEARLLETSMTPTPVFVDAGTTKVRSRRRPGPSQRARGRAAAPATPNLDSVMAWRSTLNR
jgi:HK97 family phage prohead protease